MFHDHMSTVILFAPSSVMCNETNESEGGMSQERQ